MAILRLTSPWITYYRELSELFKKDEEISIIYDEEENEVKLYVENATKAEALARLLPTEKEFGNVALKITVVPANTLLKSRPVDFEEAFKSNGAVSYMKTVRTYQGVDFTYIVFKKEVVQYFNDDLGDINGLCSTLYQNIAKNIFEETEGVYFCTDKTCSTSSVSTVYTITSK